MDDSSTWYVDYRDVALYYLGYGELPANYTYFDQTSSSTESSSKRDAYNTFGNKARLYTKDYRSTSGYAASFTNPNENRYFEADIGLDSSYARSTSWNRGAGRLVIVYKGFAEYGIMPVILYTEDHYSSFREICNYWNYSSTQKGKGGLGPYFDGETNTTTYGSRQSPTTIEL